MVPVNGDPSRIVDDVSIGTDLSGYPIVVRVTSYLGLIFCCVASRVDINFSMCLVIVYDTLFVLCVLTKMWILVRLIPTHGLPILILCDYSLSLTISLLKIESDHGSFSLSVCLSLSRSLSLSSALF